MLKHRIITAAILIPLTLLLLFKLPPKLFCLLTAVITLYGAWEWTYLMQIKTTIYRILFLVILSFAFLDMLFIEIANIFWLSFFWWCVASILILCYPKYKNWWSKSYFLKALMGIFVLAPFWVGLNYLRNLNHGVYLILFLLVLIWGADSAAYFIGRVWGKTKLIPFVSPGKSLQGFFAALSASLLIATTVLWLANYPSKTWTAALLLSMITVSFSVFGDLFESMFKREANLKDSGQLLPGHGGLLDRIDSLTAALPIFSLGVLLLIRF